MYWVHIVALKEPLQTHNAQAWKSSLPSYYSMPDNLHTQRIWLFDLMSNKQIYSVPLLIDHLSTLESSCLFVS